jgi:hypothetical protein
MKSGVVGMGRADTVPSSDVLSPASYLGEILSDRHRQVIAWMESIPRWPALWLEPRKDHAEMVGRYLRDMDRWAAEEPK